MVIKEINPKKILVYFWCTVRAQYQLAITTIGIITIDIIIAIKVGHSLYKIQYVSWSK